ncbi:unnamed protein product, partial [Closterium sp. Naga37s-1]
RRRSPSQPSPSAASSRTYASMQCARPITCALKPPTAMGWHVTAAMTRGRMAHACCLRRMKFLLNLHPRQQTPSPLHPDIHPHNQHACSPHFNVPVFVSSPRHPHQRMCVATAPGTPARMARASVLAPAPTPVSARPCTSLTPRPKDTAPVNTGVDCSAALTRGQTLNVTERDDLASCSVFYYIQPGDTCESVAASLAISSLSLQQLNPGSNCSSPLPPSRSLCIERDDGKVGSGRYCDSTYSASGTDSCTAVAEGRQLGTLVELYRLNPGLVCYSSVNAGRECPG